MSPGYERYLQGPGVSVPAHVAAWLEQAADLRKLRARVRGTNSEVDSVLQAIGVAALQHRTGTVGTAAVPTPERVAQSQVLDTRQAADRLGIGQRAITKAIATRGLPATKIAGRWVLNRNDVDNYGTRGTA